MSDETRTEPTGLEVAVVAMTGRFPGAEDLDQLWRNLGRGEDVIARFSDEELESAGVPSSEIRKPNYVPARAPIGGADLFDADYFGINPTEAEILDPQHRLFLEQSHRALELAGYGAGAEPDRVGVFAGVSMSSYLLFNLLSNRRAVEAMGDFQTLLANDKDYLPVRVSYKLDLKGPSVVVQTACSSSLVAVHIACQSLLNGECEMALAGGVSVSFPQHRGYLFQEGSIFSPDGRCRPFDHRAGGTVNGDGVGVVVLKRLEDALAAGDAVRAVILGSAINNDGSAKVGFTAPSVEGQAAVITAAQLMAEVPASSIGYVEGHGTATPLGDPIEVAALTRAFRATTQERGFCALGSIKGHLGHLDAAAGIAGLIKAVLVLEHRQIPPCPHFERPNPELELERSPFFVNRELQPWPSDGSPRRAAVSSFGIGGTNAHVVLEEAPPGRSSGPSRRHQLLVVSARTESALARLCAELADHLAPASETVAENVLADAAFTLKRGRRFLEHRRALVCTDAREAAEILRDGEGRSWQGRHQGGGRPLAFLFPGQGAQHPGMARELYDAEPVFRRHFDECLEALDPLLEVDPRLVLWPPDRGSEEAASAIRRTEVAQPLLFAVGYSLAQLFLHWGMRPEAMLGHSVGELVAACLAGVWSLPVALRLVAARGRLMQEMEPGAMLSVALGEEETVKLLGEGLEIAALNAPGLTVVAGAEGSVSALRRRLEAESIEHRLLHTSHAFHSAAMEPMLETFESEVRRSSPRPPDQRFLSNLTGDWIREDEAVDPGYWRRHVREPVRFADGVGRLLREPELIFLELGPGRVLSTFVRRHSDWRPGRTAFSSLPSARDRTPADRFLLATLGRLWIAGAEPDWEAFYREENRHRVLLPTYPFERRSYWVPPASVDTGLAMAEQKPVSTTSVDVDLETGREIFCSVVSRPALDVPYTSARDALEQRLATIWEELLGIGPIGIHDDFFELGGHSLLATQILARIREEEGIEVALRQILESPTVAALANHLRAVDANPGAVALETIQPASKEDDLVLSYSQERLWFLDQLEPGSPAYNISFALLLQGSLDVAALGTAFDFLQDRHEALRTIFDTVDGRPVQRILPPAGVGLWVADLRRVPAAQRQRETERWVVEDALRPFALTIGPLFRVGLLRLAEEEWVLLVSFHHIISDGWSFGIIARELALIYEALQREEAPSLPRLEVQYGDFAQHQRQHLVGAALEQQVEYWRQRLAHLPEPLKLPVDRQGGGVSDFRGALYPFRFSASLLRSLEDLGRQNEATLYMVLLAAWNAVLHYYSGQTDLLVGSPIAGRRLRQTEAMVGFFVNTLVMRTDLGGDPSFAELLGRVKSRALEAYAHQDLPFEKLVSALRLDRDLHRNPLFRVWLVLQNVPADALSLPGVKASSVPPRELAVRHDLKLDLTADEHGLHGFLEFRTSLFDRATIAAIVANWKAALERVAQNPDEPLSELVAALASEESRRRVSEQEELRSRARRRLKRNRRKATT